MIKGAKDLTEVERESIDLVNRWTMGGQSSTCQAIFFNIFIIANHKIICTAIQNTIAGGKVTRISGFLRGGPPRLFPAVQTGISVLRETVARKNDSRRGFHPRGNRARSD